MKLNLCEWDANPGIQTIQENILEDQLFECLCFAVSIDIDRSEFLVEPGTIKY